ncbi:MAG: hypothetical protein LUI10_13250 [Lachnospiraceae bacterium]|nr:hypothetical protein [Lachnospiraceae bacterium]
MTIQKLKGFILVALMSVMLSAATMNVKADTFYGEIEEGYTEDGIYYELYKMDKQSDELTASGSISVRREILYYAIITPPMEIEWTETISGVTYTGTLKLLNYTLEYNEQTTLAAYSGTLYATS